MDKELAELQIEYLKDLPEKLDQIYELALNLEKNHEFEKSIISLKGIIHSIKGTSGSYEITFLSELCHKFEDQLDLLEKGSSNTSKSFLFINLMKNYLDFYIPGEDNDNSDFIKKLKALSNEEETIEDAQDSEDAFKKTLVVSSDDFTSEGIRLSLSKSNTHITFVESLEHLDKIKKNTEFDELFLDESAKDFIPILENQKLHAFLKKPARIFYLKSKENDQTPKGDLITLVKSHLLIKNILDAYQGNFKQNKDDPRRILLVDDDESLHPLFKKAFKNFKEIEIITCASAQEGYKVLSEGNIDLLLLDFMMPTVSGKEMFESLKKNNSQVPTIFLTGLSKPSEIKEIEDLGVNGVISKPFKIGDLAGQVLNIWSKI